MLARVVGMVNFLDLKPIFYINSKERYNSRDGCFFSFLTIIAVVGLLSYFVVDFFKKGDLSVFLNKQNKIKPIYNMTSLPFMFSLTTALGTPLTESVVNFSPQLWKFTPENNGKPMIQKIPFENAI